MKVGLVHYLIGSELTCSWSTFLVLIPRHLRRYLVESLQSLPRSRLAGCYEADLTGDHPSLFISFLFVFSFASSSLESLHLT